MAAWLGPDGCRSNRYDPDYGWLGTQAVDGFPWSNWFGGIEIGVDGEGNALGVWVDAREAVWASRFE